jgi:hypothetical protein
MYLRIWAFLVACSGAPKDTGALVVLDESEYLEQYPEAFCELMASCDPEVFSDSYSGDVQLCIDDLTSWGRDRINRGCAFDGAAAGQCVTELHDLSCDGWASGENQASCGAIIEC